MYIGGNIAVHTGPVRVVRRDGRDPTAERRNEPSHIMRSGKSVR